MSKPKDSNDRFGPNKNHEGYSDPTAAAAIKNIEKKWVDPQPGEIWLYRRKDGGVSSKLILSRNNGTVCALYMFNSTKPIDCVSVVDDDGKQYIISLKTVETMKPGAFERRTGKLSRSSMNIIKAKLATRLGLQIKHINPEPAFDKELFIAQTEARIYKEALTIMSGKGGQ